MIGEDDELGRDESRGFWSQPSIPPGKALAVLFMLASAFVTLMLTNKIYPDQELREAVRLSKLDIESAQRERDAAVAEALKLQDEKLALLEQLVKVQAAVDDSRVASEERIRMAEIENTAKQIESDNNRLVRVAQSDSQARIAEAEASQVVSENVTRVRQIESFNDLKIRLVTACVKEKKEVAPDDEAYAGFFFDACNAEYNSTMSGVEFALMNPDFEPVDSYRKFRAVLVMTCIQAEAKPNLSLDQIADLFQLDGDSEFSATDLADNLAKSLSSCSEDFDQRIAMHQDLISDFFKDMNIEIE